MSEALPQPTLVVADRYQVLERIGEGGLGVVYRVKDVAEGTIRALKIMPRASGVANLRSEFAALARLRHDNIVRVHDYGVTESGDDYFTMEYLSGGTLTDVAPRPSDPQFFQLIGGVLQALAFLHARGLVHADIKPSNILVDADALSLSPAVAAKLVDFGLAARTSDPQSAKARGTFRYAAPEVYAGRLDPRSDLYSFGILLYELVTRHQPFPGKDVLAVIRQQRQAPPRDPREHDSSIPDGLAELVLALTEPEPAARLQTADEALSLVNDMGGTDFGVSADKPRVDLFGTLVGRDAAVELITGRWDDTRTASSGAAILVSGEVGLGKSRLLAELKLHVQLGGGHLYAASAKHQLGTPYAGLADLVRALFLDVHDRVDPGWEQALAPLWTGKAAGKRKRARSHVDHGTAWAAGDMGQTRFGMAERVASFLMEAAEHEPVALALDDLDAAELGTQEMFAYLGRSVSAGRVLLVGAARSGPVADRLAEELGHAAHFEKVELRPLTIDQVRRLVDSMLGEDVSRRLSDQVFRSSGGTPAHVGRVVEALVERGILGRERGRWVVLDDAAPIPMPTDAVAAAHQRLGSMSPRTRRVLETAAVIGERFDLDTLAEVAGPDMSDAETSHAVVEATAARLVEDVPGSSALRFLHRELREAIHGDVSPDRRMRLHTRTADILEQQKARGRAVPPAVLAEHYMAIGATERAVETSLAAADEYRLARNYHAARGWYAGAEKLLPRGTRRAAVLERLADMASAVGEADSACGIYRRADGEYEDDVSARVRVATRLAELLRRKGDSDEAVTGLMKALGLARQHRLQAEEAAAHYALARVHMYAGNYPQAAEHAAAGLLLARATGSHNLSALILKTRADIETFRGDTRAALVHVEAAVAESAHVGALTQADTFHTRGRAAIHAGDYLRAIESLERAISVYQANGRVEPEAKSLNNLGAACYFQGDWERAQTSWERFLRLCERLNDTQELVIGLSNLGCLYRDRGQFSDAIKLLERAQAAAQRIGRPHSVGLATGNLGEIHFRQGELDRARRMYTECLETFESIGAKEDLIETRRRIVEVDAAEGALDRAIDVAVDLAREAKEIGARLEEAILHRVIASTLRQNGDLESARWFLEGAREKLTGLGARYELGRVELEQGELFIAEGHVSEGKQHLESAHDIFSALGARWDLGRVRRAKQDAILAEPRTMSGDLSQHIHSSGMDILLDIARQSGKVDLEKLLEVLLQRILQGTQYERGFILLLDERGRPTERKRVSQAPEAPEFDPAEADFSGSIVKRVARTGQPMAVTNIADDDALKNQASVVALGLSSVMCAPMRRKGRVIGIVYVDSRKLAGEHKPGDLALLEALASHAAIAIENAQLVSEEQRKTELMGILAHEIRNPLAGILGFSELLPAEREELDDGAVVLVDRIHRHAQRLKRIVDNILELARVEAGKVEWSLAPVDTEALVADVRDAYEAMADKSGIRLDIDASAELPRALGNPDRLFQVLSNLVGNALKFTPKGGRVLIAVRPHFAEAPPVPTHSSPDLAAWAPVFDSGPTGHFVRVSVHDTGCGIPAQHQATLFEKFSQVEGARQSRGVGLGLYISREIIERHGGRIWVESEPEKGTAFHFTLPAA